MTLRQPLPRTWLVTDERMGDVVVEAVARVPTRAGILFRHYGLPADSRRSLFDQVRAAAPGRTILLAGPAEQARAWGADGWHGWCGGRGLHSTSVHNLRELRRAESLGAALLFLSPLFPTRSHPDAPTLGPRRFARMAAVARRPVVALGGVTPANKDRLIRLGAYGWAGVDAWMVEDRPA